MIGSKLAPVCLAFALPFQNLTDEPPSTGTSPCLYNIGDILYLRDSAGVSAPVLSGAGGILSLAKGGTGSDLSSATTHSTSQTFTNRVADGASAKSFILNNSLALPTGGAEILELQTAGTRRFAVLGTGGVFAPTAGPSATQQHTLPAVTSGTFFVSGASSVTDGALQLGDATHRLSALGLSALYSGDSQFVATSAQTEGSNKYQFQFRSGVAFTVGGGSVFRVDTAANVATAGPLLVGCPSQGQADALCWGEILAASGAIAAGQVVVWAGSKQVAAATASAGLTTIAGIALAAASGGFVPVARKGRCYANADAGITAGTLLHTSGAVAGNVLNAAVANGALIGRACEATSGTVANKVLVDVCLG